MEKGVEVLLDGSVVWGVVRMYKTWDSNDETLSQRLYQGRVPVPQFIAVECLLPCVRPVWCERLMPSPPQGSCLRRDCTSRTRSTCERAWRWWLSIPRVSASRGRQPVRRGRRSSPRSFGGRAHVLRSISVSRGTCPHPASRGVPSIWRRSRRLTNLRPSEKPARGRRLSGSLCAWAAVSHHPHPASGTRIASLATAPVGHAYRVPGYDLVREQLFAQAAFSPVSVRMEDACPVCRGGYVATPAHVDHDHAGRMGSTTPVPPSKATPTRPRHALTTPDTRARKDHAGQG